MDNGGKYETLVYYVPRLQCDIFEVPESDVAFYYYLNAESYPPSAV